MRTARLADPFNFETFVHGARSVLELGCADAQHVRSLMSRCQLGSYTGVDVDAAKIEAAQKNVGSDHVRFFCGNLLVDDLPIGNHDVIFAHDVFVLLDFVAKEKMLKRLARQLVPNGIIILNEFSPRVLVGNAFANLLRGRLTRVVYFSWCAIARFVSRCLHRELPIVEPYRFANEAWYVTATNQFGAEVIFKKGKGLFLQGRNVRYFQYL